MKNDRPKVLVGSGVGLVVGVGAIAFAISRLANGGDEVGNLLLVGAFGVFVGALLLITLQKDPFRNGMGQVTQSDPQSPAHILEFLVGERKHRVSYRWDQVWGWITVTVDDVLMVKRFVLFTFRLVDVVEVEVGTHEKHAVRIEKRRPRMASFGRAQPLKAFVDGQLVAADDGTTTASPSRGA